MAEKVEVFSDGACKGNPGPGAWGVVLERGGETEQLSGSASRTTNNRMELEGVVEGIRLVPAGSTLQVVTTSDYVFQGATKWIHGWRRRNWTKKDGKAISNQDLWQRLDRLMQDHTIRWLSAKGRQSDQPHGVAAAARLAAAAVTS